MRWIRLLRSVTSHYPFNSPRYSLLQLLPEIPSNFGAFATKGDFLFRRYCPGDEVSRHLFWFGDFEPWVKATLIRLAEPGSIAIDIGANIGATAVTLARAVGREGRLYCFEPLRVNLECLVENLKTNQLDWVEIEPTALSDMVGEAYMDLYGDHVGMARLVEQPTVASHRVSATTFDKWIATKNIGRVSVCKIDVEGHEERVLAGMSRTLAEKRIASFVFERHGDIKDLSDPVLRIFDRHGYGLFRICKNVIGHRYVPIGGQPRAMATSDFVAVSPEAVRAIA